MFKWSKFFIPKVYKVDPSIRLSHFANFIICIPYLVLTVYFLILANKFDPDFLYQSNHIRE